jgi:hypothetical protein
VIKNRVILQVLLFFTVNVFTSVEESFTGNSLSEALIFASINPQSDKRLFVELPWKLQAQNMGRTYSFHGNSMNNLLSYCGLVDARISASEKDLPVQNML